MVNVLNELYLPTKLADNKLRKKKNIICYAVSFDNIIFFKKLATSKIMRASRKLQIGIMTKKVIDIDEDYVMFSPDDFDVITYGDGAFIFNETNFYYLFTGTEILKNKLLDSENKISEVLSSTEPLFEYVKKNPKTLRSFYYIVTRSGIPKFEESVIKRINQRANKNFKLDVDGKLVCDDNNARDVYHLFMKKFGENLSTESPIIILSSSNKV